MARFHPKGGPWLSGVWVVCYLAFRWCIPRYILPGIEQWIQRRPKRGRPGLAGLRSHVPSVGSGAGVHVKCLLQPRPPTQTSFRMPWAVYMRLVAPMVASFCVKAV